MPNLGSPNAELDEEDPEDYGRFASEDDDSFDGAIPLRLVSNNSAPPPRELNNGNLTTTNGRGELDSRLRTRRYE